MESRRHTYACSRTENAASMCADSSFFREVECGGKTLKVKQLYVGDVGCVVWDAALVLCRFLENKLHFPNGFWHEKNVIDLGSGTGVVGIAAGSLGANVIVTDLPDFVELMESNIEHNSDCITGSVNARALKWGEDVSAIQSPSVVLMADVVYYKESLEDLVKTLVDLSSGETLIIMTYEERTTGDKPEIEKSFFQLMNKEFTHSVVPLSEQDANFRSTDIHIVLFRKHSHTSYYYYMHGRLRGASPRSRGYCVRVRVTYLILARAHIRGTLVKMDWKTLSLGAFAGVAAAGAIAVGYRLLKSGTEHHGDLRKSYLMNDPVSKYINSHNCEDAVLSRLRSVSVKHSGGRMTSDQSVGGLLTLLTRSLVAKKVIDVGVFTGCSSFSLALGLSEGGKVIACDVSDEYASIGKPFWIEGGVADKIDLRIQQATQTMQELIDNGESGTFDLVFIDADKPSYPTYYEMAIELLRSGGIVLVDNAIWSGKVANPDFQDVATDSIRTLNTRMKTDTRVEYVLLDIADGLGVACKK